MLLDTYFQKQANQMKGTKLKSIIPSEGVADLKGRINCLFLGGFKPPALAGSFSIF